MVRLKKDIDNSQDLDLDLFENFGKENIIQKLVEKYFREFKLSGKLEKIINYNFPVIDEEDVKQEISCEVIKAIKNLDPKKRKIQNPSHLANILRKSVMQVFTNYINMGANRIERYIKSSDGGYKLSEKEFYLSTKNSKRHRLPSVSYRKEVYLEDLLNNNGNQKDSKYLVDPEECDYYDMSSSLFDSLVYDFDEESIENSSTKRSIINEIDSILKNFNKTEVKHVS